MRKLTHLPILETRRLGRYIKHESDHDASFESLESNGGYCV